jgi:hypothetical protein
LRDQPLSEAASAFVVPSAIVHLLWDFSMFLPLLLKPLTLSTGLYSCQSCKTSTVLPQTLPVSADDFEYADGSLAPHA